MSARVYVPADSAAVSVGADEVAEALATLAKSQSIDVEIIRNGSRGMFWLEPLVEVETSLGRIGYSNVQADDIVELYAADFLDGGDHRLRVGLVEDVDYLKRQQRVTFKNVGLYAPHDLNAYIAQGGMAGLKAAREIDPQTIVETVTDSGLRGRGGAGFPAGIKWKTVADQPGELKYICCNADEGDSGTFADRLMMEADPFLLLEGMLIAARAVSADSGYIYIRSEYPAAIASMKTAVAVLAQAGWLQDTNDTDAPPFTFHVRRGAGSYVCGEESAMLESLQGKRGQVRAKPPIPAISGLFGRPTTINNVLTLASVPAILAEGAQAYAQFGVGRSTGTQPFQLAGNIKRGGLVELEFGVSLRTLIEDFGGGTATGRPFKAAQLGGPLGAYVGADELDVEMSYEALASAGAMLGHGGIVVFDDGVDLAAQARFAFDFCAHESCGKCTPCRIGSVRGRELMDRIIGGDSQPANFELLDDLCTLLEDGSLCAMGGLTPLPVRSALKLDPSAFGKTPEVTTETNTPRTAGDRP